MTVSRMLSFKSMATIVWAKIGTSLMEVCLYMNEDIPSKQIHTKLLEGLEYICIEMNFRKRKSLVIGIYKPPQSCGKMLIERLSNQLNGLHTSYDNILLLGDFNMTLKDLKLQDFCDTHDFENLPSLSEKIPLALTLFWQMYIGFPCPYY